MAALSRLSRSDVLDHTDHLSACIIQQTMSCLQPRAAKQHGAQHRIVRLIQCGSLRSQHQVANCTGGRHELTTRGWLHWSCKNPVTVCLQLRRRLVVDGVGLAVGCFASNVGGQVSLVHQLAGVLTGGPCTDRPRHRSQDGQ